MLHSILIRILDDEFGGDYKDPLYVFIAQAFEGAHDEHEILNELEDGIAILERAQREVGY